MLERFQNSLKTLQSRDRLRMLKPTDGVDFSSNDYLGLKSHASIAAIAEEALKAGLDSGSGGSRLLRGNHDAIVDLEEDAAQFFESESALFFSSGYLANLAVLSALPERGDLILFDALAHASMKEGMRASLAKRQRIAHNDLDAFESAIIAAREKGVEGIWIVVESVYSMDGDRAPLEALVELTRSYGVFLIVDEAHGTGVYGENGRGLLALPQDHICQDRVISIHTCGKALGVSGALVTMPKVLKDYLVNHARGFIYTTAPSPILAVMVRESLRQLAKADRERDMLLQKTKTLREQISTITNATLLGDTQIIPLVVGTDRKAVVLATWLQSRGLDIRAIRPPTVPEGQARLRISVTASLEKGHMDDLIEALKTWVSYYPKFFTDTDEFSDDGAYERVPR